MSHSVSYQVQLEQERKERIRKENAKKNVHRYAEMLLKEMQILGDDRQVFPERVQQLEDALLQMTALVESDPIRAEQEMLLLQDRFLILAADIRRKKETFAKDFELKIKEIRAERERKNSGETASSWVFEHWNQLDEFQQDFMRPQFSKIVQEVQLNGQNREEIWKRYRKDAEVQATQWQEKQQMAMQQKIVQTKKEIYKDRLSSEEVSQIDNLKPEEIENWEKASNDKIVDREAQEEIGRQLQSTLAKLGFSIQSLPSEGIEEIRILAKKPSGKRAQFRIQLDGSFFHKFDNYEGHTCKEESSKVMEQLRDIYGITFSEERTHWEAPLRQSNDAKPLPNTRRRGR